MMLVVIVFETFITGTLTQIPRDPNVISLVREIVTDHAQDEGRHHAFFSSFFSKLWGQLDDRQRRALGPLLPDMIVRPLEPPVSAIGDALNDIGLTRDEAGRVLEESYPREEVMAGIRRSAKATLRLFERHELYEHERTHEAFASRGLLASADGS